MQQKSMDKKGFDMSSSSKSIEKSKLAKCSFKMLKDVYIGFIIMIIVIVALVCLSSCFFILQAGSLFIHFMCIGGFRNLTQKFYIFVLSLGKFELIAAQLQCFTAQIGYHCTAVEIILSSLCN